MKATHKRIAIFVAVAVLIYAGAAFITLQPNPLAWEQSSRFLMAMLWLGVLGFFAAFPFVEDD